MLKELETFVAVVAAGSLNEAASRLRLSQPGVSRQIRSLESQLGVVLLTRGPQGVALTPVGRRVYRMGLRAVAAVDGCRRIAQDWGSPGTGRLVVAAGLTLTLFTLPPVIQEFRRMAPDVRLELVAGNSRESLAHLLAFEADVALVTSPVAHAEIQAFPLFDDPLVLAAAPGRTTARTIPELNGATLISFRGGSGLRQYVDQVLEARGVQPDVVMEFDSIEAIKTMVALDLGMALLPWSAVRADAREERLQALRLQDWPGPGRTITLLRRRAGLRAGPVGPFTAVARAVLGTRPKDPDSER